MPDTEGKILKAAEREFLSKGYAGARTTAIAKEAGVTHAMLHYYFRTKENLFAKVIDEKLATVAQSVIMPFSDEASTVEECVADVMSCHFDFVVANAAMPRFMISEVLNNEEMMRRIGETIRKTGSTVIARLQERIDQGAERGECRAVDATDLMIDIVSLNIFTVLALPLISNLLNCGASHNTESSQLTVEMILEKRKKDITDTILNKLRLTE